MMDPNGRGRRARGRRIMDCGLPAVAQLQSQSRKRGMAVKGGSSQARRRDTGAARGLVRLGRGAPWGCLGAKHKRPIILLPVQATNAVAEGLLLEIQSYIGVASARRPTSPSLRLDCDPGQVGDNGTSSYVPWVDSACLGVAKCAFRHSYGVQLLRTACGGDGIGASAEMLT